MAYVVHCKVFPELDLASEMNKAAVIARTAPRQLQQARLLDDELDRVSGWNRTAWSLCRSSPSGAVAANQPLAWLDTTRDEGRDIDDGGWKVDPGWLRLKGAESCSRQRSY
jgi:hypothetical protein